jgi:thioredoxin 1
MKPGILIVIIGLVVVAGGITYVSTREKDTAGDQVVTNTASVSENTNIANTNTTTTPPPTSTAAAQYIEYSEAALASAQAESNGYTVLYFHANWCPICRVLDPDIQAKISSLPAGLTILKADYDKETALKKKYGVTYQHTFVQVDGQGNKLKLWSGSTNASDIAAEVL